MKNFAEISPGDVVYYVSTFFIYECIVDSNINRRNNNICFTCIFNQLLNGTPKYNHNGLHFEMVIPINSYINRTQYGCVTTNFNTAIEMRWYLISSRNKYVRYKKTKENKNLRP